MRVSPRRLRRDRLGRARSRGGSGGGRLGSSSRLVTGPATAGPESGQMELAITVGACSAGPRPRISANIRPATAADGRAEGSGRISAAMSGASCPADRAGGGGSDAPAAWVPLVLPSG